MEHVHAAVERRIRRSTTPSSSRARGSTNLEYAPLAEIMGRVGFASEVFNCSAPDTGNMEVLERYGTAAQKDKWLKPLMNGEIRSAFLMTEPAVASSDATNIRCEIKRDGDDYVINGRKWWSSGAGDPRCKVAIVMGKTNPDNPKHSQQSQVLMPLDAKGVNIMRPLTVFGYDDAPHGHMEVELKDVRVPAENMLLGEGRGFEIAQGRLGPGRIHHCMRTIGAAEAALEALCKRITTRVAFGKTIAEHSVWEQRIAEARIDIELNRLLCLKAAYMMDVAGNKVAKNEIAMIKVSAPRMALQDHRRRHPGAWRRRRLPGLSAWPNPTPASARCASPTGRTKCIAAPSRSTSWPSTAGPASARREGERRHALMLIAWLLNALALGFGAALGLRALLDPKWAARFVRLKPDEQGGGEAEFRATYGGVFLFTHAVALFFTARLSLWRRRHHRRSAPQARPRR